MQEKLVIEVASELGLTPGRIRQLCGQHSLGRLLHNRLRVLTPSEVNIIKSLVRNSKPGPKPKENPRRRVDRN